MATKNRKTVRKNKRCCKSRKVRGGDPKGKMNLDIPPITPRSTTEQASIALDTVAPGLQRRATQAVKGLLKTLRQ